MLDKEEMKTILQNFSERFGDDETAMNELRRIQEDHEERINNESRAYDSDGILYSEKYDNLKRRYRERFFTSDEEIKEDQKEDIKKDSSKLTFESLFENREGDYKKGM